MAIVRTLVLAGAGRMAQCVSTALVGMRLRPFPTYLLASQGAKRGNVALR